MINAISMTSFGYAPNHFYLILDNYKNKEFIKEIPLDYEFNQLIKLKINDFILNGINPISTIQSGIAFLLDKKITKVMNQTKQPVYFVSHPHFSILNNELLQKIIDNSSIQGVLKEKIISLEKEKDGFDKITIYCTKDSLIYKDGFSPSGLSIFLKTKLKLNKKIYIDYLNLLKQKILNKSISLHFIDLKINYYITIYDHLIIIYPQNMDKSNILLIEDDDLVFDLKLKFKEKARLDKQNTLEYIEKLLSSNN